MPPSNLRSLCFKTQLCSFYEAGQCRRDTRCGFAHGVGELQAPPDLRCTKVCPTFLAQGRCENEGCLFAHSKQQVQPLHLPGFQAGNAHREDACLAESAAPLQQAVEECSTEASWTGSRASACQLDDTSSLVHSLTDDSDMQEKTAAWEEPGSDEQSCDGTSTSSPRARVTKNIFHKTQMCQYYLQGRCKRLFTCNYAHGRAELRPSPDLARTKLCPWLARTGECLERECHFAHSEEELRLKPSKCSPTTSRAGGEAAALVASMRGDVEVGAGTVSGSEGQSGLCAVGQKAHGSQKGVRLVVKHTFLAFEELPFEAPRRRAHSAPCTKGLRTMSGE